MGENVTAQGGVVQVVKDLTGGTVGGFVQVLVGQPFDIVKVRLQSGDAYSGMLDATIRIGKEEGPLAFYKGTALPLLGIGACVSLQFGFLEAFKRHFRASNMRSTGSDQLSLGQLYLSGAAAGVGNSIVSGPVEHIRIRLQTQSKPPALGQTYYHGPSDALKQIYRSDGVRGIFHGQAATLLREFHGYGMYFLGYEILVERHIKKHGGTRKDIPTAWAIVYGAGAGYSMWLTSYPLGKLSVTGELLHAKLNASALPTDVIKSRIQNDGLPSSGKSRKYLGVLDCARKLWRAEGIKGFTRGLTPTLIRSPAVNGATFAAFETTMRLIG